MQKIRTLGFYYILILLVASCTTQRKAEGFFDKHQAEAAAYCAARFPDQETVVVRDSIVSDTVYIQEPDSIGGFRDDINDITPGIVYYRPKPCPPTKVITRTRYRDSTITKESGPVIASIRFQLGAEVRKREAVEQELQKAIVEAKKVKAQRNKLRWIVFVIAGAVATVIGFKVARWLGNWGPFFKAIGK